MKETKRILYSCNSACKSLPNRMQVTNVTLTDCFGKKKKKLVDETVGHSALECMKLVCSLQTGP